MSAAVKTMINEWMIPRMGVRQIRTEALAGNAGSVRVFEKNNFVLQDTVLFEILINCGERYSGYHILHWTHSET